MKKIWSRLSARRIRLAMARRRFRVPGPGAIAAHRPGQRRLHQPCHVPDRHCYVAVGPRPQRGVPGNRDGHRPGRRASPPVPGDSHRRRSRGDGPADRLRADVLRNPHRRPVRRQLRPDVTSGRPGGSTGQCPDSSASCAGLRGAGADPSWPGRKEAPMPGLRRRVCAGFSLNPGGASPCAAPLPARRRRNQTVTERSGP